MMLRVFVVLLPLCVVAAIALALYAYWPLRLEPPLRSYPQAPPGQSIPVAVIGDSDSHSYQDRVSFPPGNGRRGGPYRATTLQWTEALATLRGGQLDLGAWQLQGARPFVARAAGRAGLTLRSPRKEDFRHNFAVSGDGCDALLGGSSHQLRSLLRLMDDAPERWRKGVVIVRIGVNSFGTEEDLDLLARDPASPPVQDKIASCVRAIRQAVAALHASHPQTRIVLVGIFDNTHWAELTDRWQSPGMLRNIGAGLDRFDQPLRAMAQQDPRLAFFDDRAWFAAHWGGRDAQGRPAYGSVAVGNLRVANTAGDEPRHATLADGHAGTVWNGMWAQSLVALLNARFGAGIAPITDAELASLLIVDADSAGAASM